MNAGGRPAQGTRARGRGCALRPTAPVACTSPRLRTVDRVRRGFKAAVIAARPGRRSARWPWIRDGRFTGADDRPAAPPRWSNGKDVRLSPEGDRFDSGTGRTIAADTTEGGHVFLIR